MPELAALVTAVICRTVTASVRSEPSARFLIWRLPVAVPTEMAPTPIFDVLSKAIPAIGPAVLGDTTPLVCMLVEPTAFVPSATPPGTVDVAPAPSAMDAMPVACAPTPMAMALPAPAVGVLPNAMSFSPVAAALAPTATASVPVAPELARVLLPAPVAVELALK